MRPEKEDYDKQYEDCKSKVDNETSPCKQLDVLRECMVELSQEKNTYFPRPCIRDWPCLFTQHRSNIEKLTEKFAPIEARLRRECEKQSIVDIGEKLKMQTNNNANANYNHNINNSTLIDSVSIPTPKNI